uniref:Uncharacterized protein n=1 Tax=Chromera velia CCMP2878 TaxID=1169474 RepID=A0A0G4IBK1_9ALVE|eukprot:Cvel_2179.t1-p1 / transcript=Cvel_2179.t1 / gene=Cvel_2179 / organism=Chromera_velia_CCMP2878 / gene_product=hypothetical protein / transcript_product=hypothetical protein / location=Cvel_scaffold84:88864-101957(+) / protein_length=1266 / sequence_SO=supercontig / SO=protein_coding / is_pseudo=false
MKSRGSVQRGKSAPADRRQSGPTRSSSQPFFQSTRGGGSFSMTKDRRSTQQMNQEGTAFNRDSKKPGCELPPIFEYLHSLRSSHFAKEAFGTKSANIRACMPQCSNDSHIQWSVGTGVVDKLIEYTTTRPKLVTYTKGGKCHAHHHETELLSEWVCGHIEHYLDEITRSFAFRKKGKGKAEFFEVFHHVSQCVALLSAGGCRPPVSSPHVLAFQSSVCLHSAVIQAVSHIWAVSVKVIDRTFEVFRETILSMTEEIARNEEEAERATDNAVLFRRKTEAVHDKYLDEAVKSMHASIEATLRGRLVNASKMEVQRLLTRLERVEGIASQLFIDAIKSANKGGHQAGMPWFQVGDMDHPRRLEEVGTHRIMDLLLLHGGPNGAFKALAGAAKEPNYALLLTQAIPEPTAETATGTVPQAQTQMMAPALAQSPQIQFQLSPAMGPKGSPLTPSALARQSKRGSLPVLPSPSALNLDEPEHPVGVSGEEGRVMQGSHASMMMNRTMGASQMGHMTQGGVPVPPTTIPLGQKGDPKLQKQFIEELMNKEISLEDGEDSYVNVVNTIENLVSTIDQEENKQRRMLLRLDAAEAGTAKFAEAFQVVSKRFFAKSWKNAEIQTDATFNCRAEDRLGEGEDFGDGDLALLWSDNEDSDGEGEAFTKRGGESEIASSSDHSKGVTALGAAEKEGEDGGGSSVKESAMQRINRRAATSIYKEDVKMSIRCPLTVLYRIAVHPSRLIGMQKSAAPTKSQLMELLSKAFETHINLDRVGDQNPVSFYASVSKWLDSISRFSRVSKEVIVQRLLTGIRDCWPSLPPVRLFGAFLGMLAWNQTPLYLEDLRFFLRLCLSTDVRLARQESRQAAREKKAEEERLKEEQKAQEQTQRKSFRGRLSQQAAAAAKARSGQAQSAPPPGQVVEGRPKRERESWEKLMYYHTFASFERSALARSEGRLLLRRFFPHRTQREMEGLSTSLLGPLGPRIPEHKHYLDVDLFLERCVWKNVVFVREHEENISQEFARVTKVKDSSRVLFKPMNRAQFRKAIQRSVICPTPTLKDVRFDPIYLGFQRIHLFPSGGAGEMQTLDLWTEALQFKQELLSKCVTLQYRMATEGPPPQGWSARSALFAPVDSEFDCFSCFSRGLLGRARTGLVHPRRSRIPDFGFGMRYHQQYLKVFNQRDQDPLTADIPFICFLAIARKYGLWWRTELRKEATSNILRSRILGFMIRRRFLKSRGRLPVKETDDDTPTGNEKKGEKNQTSKGKSARFSSSQQKT